jgi:acyl-CoA synthetase (AMP-forming)/AMP-acid ligase II
LLTAQNAQLIDAINSFIFPYRNYRSSAQSIMEDFDFYGVEMKIVDDEGRELPWDGKAFGSLALRGPWVCSSYFKYGN